MSAATLIRSPADCINAVLANLEFNAKFIHRNIARMQERANHHLSIGNHSMSVVYDDLIFNQSDLLKQNRDHQQLIRVECAELLAVHAEMVQAGGA